MTGSQLRSDLQGSRDRLFASIRGAGEEQFRWAPPDGWPIAAHLAHLLRIERLFTERAARALVEDTPRVASTGVTSADDPALAQHLAVPQIVHGMQAARRRLDALLAGCDEAALRRACVHEQRGRMTIEEIAVKMARHEDEHAATVAALVRQAPSSGRVIIPLARRS